MKTDRIMWGIVLLFIGGVLLLENFNVIEFYWRNVWRFWPIFLIIAGVNILFNKNKSRTGSIISIVVLVLTLSVLFYKGQERPNGGSRWFGDRFKENIEITDDEDNDHNYEQQTFAESYDSIGSATKTILNISGGGTSFRLKGETDSLIVANVHRKSGYFSLQKVITDTLNTINFKMKGKSKWNMGDGGNDVDLQLNKQPEWTVNMNMGAGEVNFDFSDYKIRTLNFDGGAAALDIRLGSLLPITDVNVKTGVADVKVHIPSGSGCRIVTKTGLSARDFTGFTKLKDGTYETPNYATSTKKIFIRFDGGLSNFEVQRY